MSALVTDTVFDLDALLSDEERGGSEGARVRHRAHPADDRGGLREQALPARARRRDRRGRLPRHAPAGLRLRGAGAVEYGLVCLELEAADSGWRTFVSVQGSLAMTAIHKCGSEEQKQQWLPRMARGELIGCFALTEPSGGSDPAAMTTIARRDGDDWVLDGAKRWIGLACIADVAVVWANDRRRRARLPGPDRHRRASPRRRSTAKLSMRASIQCDVTFDGVRLPAAAMLPGPAGCRGPFCCLNEARYGIVWGAMGAARDSSRRRSVRAGAAAVRQAARRRTSSPRRKLVDMCSRYEKGMLLALQLGRLKERGKLRPAQIAGQAEQRARGDRDRPRGPHHPRRERHHPANSR